MPTPLYVRIIIWLWLIAALVVGQQQWLGKLPGPAIQGIILVLTAALLACYLKGAGFRAWIDSLDLRALVLLHVTRFVGIYFLILYQRGELPYAFAVPGGWGDILVATLALPVCFVPMNVPRRHRAITIWNVIGLVDILMVVVTAARLGLEHIGQLRALTYLPLSLLPTFLVPLVIATHVMIYLRLRREPAPA
jgi:hypothetical protein